MSRKPFASENTFSSSQVLYFPGMPSIVAPFTTRFEAHQSQQTLSDLSDLRLEILSCTDISLFLLQSVFRCLLEAVGNPGKSASPRRAVAVPKGCPELHSSFLVRAAGLKSILYCSSLIQLPIDYLQEVLQCFSNRTEAEVLV